MWKRLSDLTKRYWSFFICVLLCSAAAECIGPIKVSFGELTITFLPLLYAMIFMLVLYLAKPVRGVGKAFVPAANQMLSMGVVFAMAKLGISGGASIEQMISASPILILQNIGNIGTVLVALPVALLLGMGREAVGMTHALSREPNVALIADKQVWKRVRGIPGSDGLLYCRDCFWQHFYEYCSACVYCPGAFQPGGGGYGGGMRQLLYDGLRAGGSD